jgi:hypothetical protein
VSTFKEKGAEHRFCRNVVSEEHWELVLQGKHPEGYEIIYIDEDGNILSKP